jgi:hypothetical protein
MDPFIEAGSRFLNISLRLSAQRGVQAAVNDFLL